MPADILGMQQDDTVQAALLKISAIVALMWLVHCSVAGRDDSPDSGLHAEISLGPELEQVERALTNAHRFENYCKTLAAISRGLVERAGNRKVSFFRTALQDGRSCHPRFDLLGTYYRCTRGNDDGCTAKAAIGFANAVDSYQVSSTEDIAHHAHRYDVLCLGVARESNRLRFARSNERSLTEDELMFTRAQACTPELLDFGRLYRCHAAKDYPCLDELSKDVALSLERAGY